MAVNVLPYPVAICASARGLPRCNDVSRLVIAVIWHARRPSVFRCGSVCNPDRRDNGSLRHAFSVSVR